MFRWTGDRSCRPDIMIELLRRHLSHTKTCFDFFWGSRLRTVEPLHNPLELQSCTTNDEVVTYPSFRVESGDADLVS